MRKYSLLFVFLLTTSNLLAQNAETIRVGVFLDMSGQTSSFGIASYNGIKMAVREINDAGGVNGRKLEVFLEDDLGRPDVAQEVAKRLIADHKVHVLFGGIASTNSLAAAYVAQKEKVLMIASSATNPKVTAAGDYIFRTCFVDPMQGGAMAKFAYNNLKLRRIAIFSDAWSDYSKSLAAEFRDTFTRLRGNISGVQEYSQMDIDYKRQLKRMRKTKPEALYLSGYYGQVAIIAKQSRELGMKVPLLGGDGWDSPELWKLGGKALINSYVTTHFAADNHDASTVKNFRRKYLAVYKAEPDLVAALAYDTVYLFANAVRHAKSLDNRGLRDALAVTTDFKGVTGPIVRFDSFRNPVKQVIIVESIPKTSSFAYQSTIQP